MHCYSRILPLLGKTYRHSFSTFIAVCKHFDQVVQKVPGTKPIRGKILDTVLGPEDDVEYVSRTT